MTKNNIFDNKYFILFSDCVLVKGDNRSTICDLTRNKFKLIPNDLYSFVEWSNKKSGKQIKIKYKEYLSIISEYLEFLDKNEFFFWGEKHDINRFSPLKMEFEEPFLITNSIIEINLKKIEIYTKVISEMIKHGVKIFQLRFYEKPILKQFEHILELFLGSRVNQIEMCFSFNYQINLKQLEKLLNKYPRVKSVFIYDTPINTIQIVPKLKKHNITFSAIKILSSQDYTNENPANFIINNKFFFESQEHNTYFNKKLCVDYNGNVKNSPELKESFGKINNFNFEQIANDKEFQKLWYISKNKIDICKGCEFRYVCFDVREPKLNGNGSYYMIENCEYKK